MATTARTRIIEDKRAAWLLEIERDFRARPLSTSADLKVNTDDLPWVYDNLRPWLIATHGFNVAFVPATRTVPNCGCLATVNCPCKHWQDVHMHVML